MKEDAINTQEMSEQEMWLALPGVENEEKAELLIGLARVAALRGSHSESLELAQAALRVYEELGPAAPIAEVANCHWGKGYALHALNQMDDAITEIDQAIELYREANYPFLDDVLRTRAQWCAESKDWEGTLAAHLEAVRLNEIEGNTKWEAKSWLNVGIAYCHMMRFPDALQAFTTARTKFAEIKIVPEVARADLWLAEAYAELGDSQLAYHHARKSLNVSEFTQERIPVMFAEFAVGKALLTGGELLSDAESHLLRSYNQATAVDSGETDWDFIVKVQRERIKLLRRMERSEQADSLEESIRTITEVIEP